ncbi:MAG: 50S ribosomal protein L19 [Bacteroidota bacterium]
MDLMKVVEKEYTADKQFPEFSSGDTITVYYKIKEGNKERTQFFRGVVLQKKGSGHTETFTIRKMSGNVGVERIFPLSSPSIEKIEINKKGKVRRAKIFYFRDLRGKKAKIKEKRYS